MDDESDACFVLKELLSEDGFVVDSYKDPLLALSNFKAHFYSLVILDIRMPRLNGFASKPIDNEELLKRISEIVIDDTGFEANDMGVLTK